MSTTTEPGRSVPWLRHVPAGWTRLRLKYLVRFVSGGTPDTAKLDYWGGSIPWVSPKDMKCSRLTDTQDHITGLALRESATVAVPEGTPLLVVRSGILRHTIPVAVASRRMAINQDIKALIPQNGRVHPDYFARFVEGHNTELLREWRKEGTTVESLELPLISDFEMIVPEFDEQRAIVRFLDRETARIDALIEKKRRQIELLHEKRAALISHAVTRGLDPNAPMKDSGIEWLGMVPAQWHHRKLGYLASVEGGCTPRKANPEYWIGDIPWVSPKDMKSRMVSDSEDHVSEEAVRETSLRLLDPPVVLMVVRGMILAHTFPVALTTVPVTINQDMKALRPKLGCSAQYFAHLLEGISSLILSLVEESAHGTKCLRTEIWRDINVFLPSPTEQANICTELDRQSGRISFLVDRISLSIDRLREYRTALISAAVTGKIDVRQEVA